MARRRLKTWAEIAGILAAAAVVATFIAAQWWEPERVPESTEQHFRIVPGATAEWDVPGAGNVVFRVVGELPSYASSRVEAGVDLDINAWGERERVFTFRRGDRVVATARVIVVGVD